MTRSEQVEVNSSPERTERALEAADAFLLAQGLSGRNAVHVRLLAEETLGMVRAMTGEFSAQFWLERDGAEYRIRLSAQTDIDKQTKKELLSVSSTGKNAAVKGVMSKIGDIFSNGMLHYSDVMKMQQKYSGGYVGYGLMGLDTENAMIGVNQYDWSLQRYRRQLGDAMQTQAPAQEAWDELEKSIVASLADDVVVGVKKDSVDMTIRFTAKMFS